MWNKTPAAKKGALFSPTDFTYDDEAPWPVEADEGPLVAAFERAEVAFRWAVWDDPFWWHGGFSWGRHHFERMFHGKCLTALAPTLFGADEWATYGADLVQERGWSLLSKMVIGTAPRRFGKSVSLAKVVAALAHALLMHRAGLNFTEYNITVFSTGKRASILLSNYVKKFLAELGLMDKENCEITKQTEERLELRRQGLTVIFMFVPANPDTYVLIVLFCLCFLMLVVSLLIFVNT